MDFEFIARPGERPVPVCLVAKEFHTGRVLRFFQDELMRMDAPPYDVGPGSLFVAYYASAEIGCHLALGWTVPANVLDLFTEFRNLTNGLRLPCGAGLLGAMTYFGLDGISVVEKKDMRELALRGGPWTGDEKRALLNYCESDVLALERLLPHMLPRLDIPRALLRGRYMRAAAHMEHNGVPIDMKTLSVLRRDWMTIRERLISPIDEMYGVYEGGTFRMDRWEKWLDAHGIPWPRLESGQLDLKADTFKDMARAFPEVTPLHELRTTLARLHLEKLTVGTDGRNRCILSAFRSITGRNQPSNTAFIFGPAVWIRGLIKPEPGIGLAYVDWSGNEFGIAAALSGDPAMIKAYLSGDPYLAFAIQAGAAPSGATEQTHSLIRSQFKWCCLATLYSMGETSLAARLGISPAAAHDLLQLHHKTYPGFWEWSDAAVDYAMLHNEIHTAFGWRLHVTKNTKVPTLRNFPMQANGAEMLRLACCFATERGIRVCGPIHDALLIEACVNELDATVEATQKAMGEASKLVLDGFELRTEVKLIKYPDRYMDERGERMWQIIMGLINEDHE